jgi:hypothetical protein
LRIQTGTAELQEGADREFEYMGGVNKRNINIKRNDSMQIETYDEIGLTMKFRIEWNGDCKYSLKALSVLVNGKDTSFNLSALPVVNTQIKGYEKLLHMRIRY